MKFSFPEANGEIEKPSTTLEKIGAERDVDASVCAAADEDASDDETPLDIVAAKQSKKKPKVADESIYDFEEDERDPKPRLVHERPRRRSRSESDQEEEEKPDPKSDPYKDIDTQLDASKVCTTSLLSIGVTNRLAFPK